MKKIIRPQEAKETKPQAVQRRFFLPQAGVSVEAATAQEAIKKVGESLEEKPQDV